MLDTRTAQRRSRAAAEPDTALLHIGTIPYNPKHVYSIVVSGISGRLTLRTGDLYEYDNTGSFRVSVEQLP